MSKPQIQAVEMPPVKEYLKEIQRDGSELCADEIFKETMLWLKQRGCDNVVSAQTVEQYALSVARWIHIERLTEEDREMVLQLLRQWVNEDSVQEEVIGF